MALKVLVGFLGLSSVRGACQITRWNFLRLDCLLNFLYCFCLKYVIVDINIADHGQTAFVEQYDHGLECLLTFWLSVLNLLSDLKGSPILVTYQSDYIHKSFPDTRRYLVADSWRTWCSTLENVKWRLSLLDVNHKSVCIHLILCFLSFFHFSCFSILCTSWMICACWSWERERWRSGLSF